MNRTHIALLSLLACACTTPTAPAVDGGPTPNIADGGANVDAAPSLDAAVFIDAAVLVDAGGTCSPAGTYDIVWTPSASNPSTCGVPSATGLVLASGIPAQNDGSATTCPPGCDTADTCTIAPVDTTCSAHVHIHPPCGSISQSGLLDIALTYDGDTLHITEQAEDSTHGSCSYTGVGTRR